MNETELKAKCDKIINFLIDLEIVDKYKVVKTLYDSLLDVCEREGIAFVDLTRS